jgi:hypothetical protein
MASNGPPFKKRKITLANGEEREVHYFTGPDPVPEQAFHTPADWNQLANAVPVEKQEGAFFPSWCNPGTGSIQEQIQMFVQQQQQKEATREVKVPVPVEKPAFAANGGGAALSSFLANSLPNFRFAPPNLPSSTEANANKRKRSFSVFDQPLAIVQPQRKYLRNQLHMSLVGSTIVESDFSDDEGTVTLYKHVTETNERSMMGEWHSSIKPIATLYAPHISKIFGDEKYLYSVTGGEDLWLTWWDVSKNYEMQQLNLTHKLIPLKIDLPVLVTCTLVDKTSIYIGINKGHIIILDKNSKRISKVLKLKANTFPHMLKTDEVYLYAAFSDATVRLWYKLDKWKKKKHVFFDKNEKNVVKAVEIIGKYIYVAFTKAIQIWERIDNNNFREITSHKTDSDLQAFAVDNDFMYLSLNGTIEVRTKTGALGIVNSVVHPGIVRNLFIDKSTLYIDSHPLVAMHNLTLARLDELRESPWTNENPDPVSGIRITLSDPQFILGGCRDGRTLIWKRETNTLVAVVPPPATPPRPSLPITTPVNQMITSFAVNRNYFFVGYFTGQLRVIERASFCHENVTLIPTNKNAHKHALLRTSCYISHIYVDEEILIVSHADGTVVFSYLKDINFGDNPDMINANYMQCVMLNEQINTQMNPVVEKPTTNANGGSFTLNTVYSFKVQRHKNLIYVATTNGYITVFALQPQITKIGWFYFGQFTHPSSFYADDKYFYVSYAEPMNKSSSNMNRPPNSNPASPSPSPGATPEVQRRNMNDPPVMANYFVKIYSVEGSINEFMTINTNFTGPVYSIFADVNSLYVCSKYGELKVFKKEAKFAIDYETKCNWREIESMSKIPYQTYVSYPTFFPAFAISEHKWVDAKESKTRGDVEASTITPAFSINDSCVVVTRSSTPAATSADPTFSPRSRGITPARRGDVFSQDTTIALALTFD